jgi:hypothetical protein
MSESCHCGRPLLSRAGDLEATCGECHLKRDHCECESVDPDGDHEDATLPAAPEFPNQKAKGPLRDLMDWADKDGLPVSFVAAAGETALATAAAGRLSLGAYLQLTSTRRVLPVLWEALIADSGSAKNPSIKMAKAPITSYYDKLLADWQESCDLSEETKTTPEPRPQALIQSSVGTEAMARWLSKTGGSGLLSNGELGSFLRGLGQYKAGGGSDRYDAMDIWSSEPVSIERVGDGGGRNAVQVYVPCPRMSIIGGLVPENVRLLGSESDGLRARFLPVLPSSQVVPNLDGSEPLPSSWIEAVNRLLELKAPREWLLRGAAREMAKSAVSDWKARQMDGADPVVVKTALAKADEQCFRIALSVADSEEPGGSGDIPLWAVEYAIARVEYSLGVWLALGSDQVMAFSRKDEVLNAGVADLLRAIEARTAMADGRKYMTRRDIQMSQVAGATTSVLADTLIRSYLSAYTGCVTVYSEQGLNRFPAARLLDRSEAPPGSSRGPAPVVVWAPARRAQITPGTSQRPLRETVGPTVSGKCTDSLPPDEPAGQGAAADPGDSRKLLGDQPSNSFHPTVSGGGSDAKGLAGAKRTAGTKRDVTNTLRAQPAGSQPPGEHEQGQDAFAGWPDGSGGEAANRAINGQARRR